MKIRWEMLLIVKPMKIFDVKDFSNHFGNLFLITFFSSKIHFRRFCSLVNFLCNKVCFTHLFRFYLNMSETSEFLALVVDINPLLWSAAQSQHYSSAADFTHFLNHVEAFMGMYLSLSSKNRLVLFTTFGPNGTKFVADSAFLEPIGKVKYLMLLTTLSFFFTSISY